MATITAHGNMTGDDAAPCSYCGDESHAFPTCEQAADYAAGLIGNGPDAPAMPYSRADTFAALSLDELRCMSDRAYRDAARCWAEYHSAAQAETGKRGKARDDARALTQMLHDAAWSAENFWRATYDAIKVRKAERNV